MSKRVSGSESVTSGANMFSAFLKGFVGGLLQVAGAAVFVWQLGCYFWISKFWFRNTPEQDATVQTALLESAAYIAGGLLICLLGAYMRYQSKQTVQIAGTQTTTEKR